MNLSEREEEWLLKAVSKFSFSDCWIGRFDAGAVERAYSYFARSQVSFDGIEAGQDKWVVNTVVKGSRAEPYRTRVMISRKEAGMVWGVCSCPVGQNCKHVVASLLFLDKEAKSRQGTLGQKELFDFAWEEQPRLPDDLRNWVERLVEKTAPPSDKRKPGAIARGVMDIEAGGEGFVVQLAPYDQGEETPGVRGGWVGLSPMVVKRLQSGDWGQNPSALNLLHSTLPRWVSRLSAADLGLLEDLLTLHRGESKTQILAVGRLFREPLQQILESGGAIWERNFDCPLQPGPLRRIDPAWVDVGDGLIQTGVCFDGTGKPAWVLDAGDLIYVDPGSSRWGVAELALPEGISFARWMSAPPCEVEDSAVLRDALESKLSSLKPPSPRGKAQSGKGKPSSGAEGTSDSIDAGSSLVAAEFLPPTFELEMVEGKDHPPRGLLRLMRCEVRGPRYRADYFRRAQYGASLDFADFPVAEVKMCYSDYLIDNPLSAGERLKAMVGNRIIELVRDFEAEAELMELLEDEGLSPVWMHDLYPGAAWEESESLMAFLSLKSDAEMVQRWLQLVGGGTSRLQDKGWKFEIDPSFGLDVTAPDDWYAGFEEEGSGIEWMQFDYGFEVGGEKVSLLEALASFLAGQSAGFDPRTFLERPEEENIPLLLPGKDEVVLMPVRRLGEVLVAVSELLDFPLADGRLSIHSLRAAQLTDQLNEVDERALAEELRELRSKCLAFDGVPAVHLPEGLTATLRTYQQEGVAWLQFLREFRLNGILADDMGLGKTVQTLSCLLIERESGRQGGLPSLVVAPTSVISNWVVEARCFTPGLSVLLLHGSDRRGHFDSLADYDLVVTSYALLTRDAETLSSQDWHYVVLDEAQMIKNPKSKMALTACSLKSRHRLCLTGTPMENHLGELWSLLHFLMPGFFGGLDVFRRVWQRPIEKNGDAFKRQLLVQRVAPILLRRTKDEVLGELPPRTNIVRRVALDRRQLQLYESVRAAMDSRVRDALAEKGMARSHIIILDALLKLRQICCHPRLLKTASAQEIDQSAKLDEFRSLVSELVEEGRRILVFSQFTSMLTILEESLSELGIDYLKLTGRTVKRKEVIAAFQNGEAPVFLISLKAGGSGLNLTAADAVIHYDPWWNPAVEEQATARAHRMGQDKPVFVYRLVTEGTIEDRILELQERKAELARAVLAGGGEEGEGKGLRTLERSDLEALLAPVAQS